MSCDPEYLQKYNQFVTDCNRYGVMTNYKSVILPGDDISWYQPEMFSNVPIAGFTHVTWNRLFRSERRAYQRERKKQ